MKDTGSVDGIDRALIEAMQNGLPLAVEPYAHIADGLGLPEEEVISRLRSLLARGVIKRLGVVVRHHELGYRANAMVVWDIPDEQIDAIGELFSQSDFVTLCYRRPRRLPDWPYNLFCMIHGRDRDKVLAHVEDLAKSSGVEHYSHRVLFSSRRFKQRGANYRKPSAAPPAAPATAHAYGD